MYAVLRKIASQDPATFALEKHLEDFLVQNWGHTDLGKAYDVFTDEVLARHAHRFARPRR